LGFPLTGTLGVLLLAKERNLVGSVSGEISRLQESGLHLGTAHVERTKELAGE
jgi:predicted nucleic acid-binding protein